MALFAVAALGLLAAVAGQVWHSTAQRLREADLLFAGQQYRQALDSFYAYKAGGAQQYPAKLEDLLDDRRSQVTLRHLRRLYPDPMTGRADWVLVKAGERIVGLHSRSEASSFKRNFDESDAGFNGTDRYAQWVFRAGSAGGTGEGTP
ncbi:type II secretory pathway, pseudopilin PulG [Rhodoferax lacus]|uniref:Type II secretory pathway, pseudopilin PulG n=2 Tax=Rhodoferax lacus TaxID=2184758 RepID=A0A3E1R991_9BURK|nr:type II secretory pathway, pseudopilin PulG [Rhodoferax lacus]